MGTLVVKGLTIVNNCKSLTLNETCTCEYSSFMCNGSIVIELRVFNDKKKKMNNIAKKNTVVI